VLNTLLRFICLTLPICAGIEPKTWSKEEKQRRSTKVNLPWRVKDGQRRVRGEQVTESTEITRTQLAKGEPKASNSPRRAPKASKFKEHQKSLALNSPKANQRRATRNGEWICSRGELGRLNPSEVAWHKPTGEVTSTCRGEWMYSRGELMQIRKVYISPLDPFIEDLSFWYFKLL